LEGRFRNVSFALRRGEILGLAGLVGAGRSEVAQTIFGRFRADAGNIRIKGAAVRIHSPSDAVRAGIVYLPEDRKASGVFGGLSLQENLFSASLGRHSRLGLVNRREARAAAKTWVRELGIRTPSVDQPMALLSGGNQQKALIARGLDVKPRVLIADEPTRGIDVGAKAEIHALLRRLCAEGIGLIVISSELPEILGLCDRVLVLHDGGVAGELSGTDATEESVMALATGQRGRREGEAHL